MEWDKNGQPLLTAWTVNGSMPLGIELGPCTMTDSFGGVSQLDSTLNVPVTPYPFYFSRFSSPAGLQRLRAERDRQGAAQAASGSNVLKNSTNTCSILARLSTSDAAISKGITPTTHRYSRPTSGTRREDMALTNQPCRMKTEFG